MLHKQRRWDNSMLMSLDSWDPLARISFFATRVCNKLKIKGTIFLSSRFAIRPLLCRLGTSDRWIFHQIFVQQEYAPLLDIENVDLIIDCGAYIGYSAAYFLSRFPQAHVIAIEPDKDNFELLKKNLSPYGERAELIHGAIWSNSAKLTMSDVYYRGAQYASRQVRECLPDEPGEVCAVDIPSLLANSRRNRISILKVDIEGSEGIIFGAQSGCEKWLHKVDAIAIELHDDSQFGNCTLIFQAAISKQAFEVSQSGELTICRRTKRSGAWVSADDGAETQ